LPWFVVGQLDTAERARVEAHLAQCASCRDEASAVAVEADAVVRSWPDVDRGWARLLPHLEERATPARVLPFARSRRMFVAPALMAAGLALGVLVARAMPPWVTGPARDAPGYRGLGQASAPGNALLILSPGAHEADLRAVVRAVGATVVDGPTAANAWVLRVPDDGFEQRIAALAASPHVRLAHPLVEVAP
jgi:hypothetical protein